MQNVHTTYKKRKIININYHILIIQNISFHMQWSCNFRQPKKGKSAQSYCSSYYTITGNEVTPVTCNLKSKINILEYLEYFYLNF